MNTSHGSAALAVAFGGFVALGLAGSAAGVTLFDQRTSAIAGTWDGARPDYIGGVTRPSNPNLLMADVQSADDFPLSTKSHITGVTADFRVGAMTITPIFDPTGGFLVEIFANIAGNHPAETPTWSLTTSAFTNLGAFTPALGWTAAQCATYSIDLSAGNLVLDPGMWWISVVPVDISAFGLPYSQVGVRTPGAQIGAAAHQRAGGIDHGNGYTGLGNPNDWTAQSGSTNGSIKEASFRLDGEAVPAPSTGAVLAVGFLACLGRRRGAATR